MKKITLLWLILGFLAVGLVLAGVVWWRGKSSFGPAKSGRLSGPVRLAKAPRPPSQKVTLYKGFWMPCSFMDDRCQPMNDVNLLKEMGVNLIGIAPNIKINPKGEIDIWPLDYTEKRLNEILTRYYAVGIRVFISPELDYTEDFKSRSQGEPRPIPKNVAAQPGFMDKYDEFIVALAKLAQKYQVEFFSPLNEPDMKLGVNVASGWGQQILPKIKENYQGKTMWKVGMAYGGEIQKINFVGYDAVGIDFTAGGGSESQALANYPQMVDQMIDGALGVAKRDNVPTVMLTEVGVWGGAIQFSEAGKTKVHEIILEQGQGKVTGFVFLDQPPDLRWSLKNTPSMEIIKTWFTQKL